ncbi:transcription antitermination factor NusB [Peptococcus simiae]|uniref:transcription antitermination factor NusB n=1 Tax=Peptococcus simiae TaxID=1643805 RepID=UPI00397F9F68
MKQDKRAARLMTFLCLYAEQESGAEDTGILDHLYPTRFHLADLARAFGLTEIDPLAAVRSWLYDRLDTPKSDRLTTQAAMYDLLADFYEGYGLAAEQKARPALDMEAYSTFFAAYVEASEKALHKAAGPDWQDRLIQELLADIAEQAFFYEKAPMVLARDYFKAKNLGQLLAEGPMVNALLGQEDLGAYQSEVMAAWLDDADLKGALGKNIQAADLLALDGQAVAGHLAGIANQLEAIDEDIRAVANKWRLDRLASCDRAILRLGTYEIKYAPAPADPALVINEAVELAKTYGDDDAYKFINGALDSIAKGRPADE